MIRGGAVDTGSDVADRTRILALLALALPGLLLSGAVHLCICLGALLASGEGPCASAAPDCCARFEAGSTVEDAADCGDCCIVLDVAGGPPLAPLGDAVVALELPALAPAPDHVAAAPPLNAASRGNPARAVERRARAPGRAPVPLRI